VHLGDVLQNVMEGKTPYFKGAETYESV